MNPAAGLGRWQSQGPAPSTHKMPEHTPLTFLPKQGGGTKPWGTPHSLKQEPSTGWIPYWDQHWASTVWSSVELWNCVFPLQEQHLAISSPARAVLGQEHQALVFPLLWVQEALSPPSPLLLGGSPMLRHRASSLGNYRCLISDSRELS